MQVVLLHYSYLKQVNIVYKVYIMISLQTDLHIHVIALNNWNL